MHVHIRIDIAVPFYVYVLLLQTHMYLHIFLEQAWAPIRRKLAHAQQPGSPLQGGSAFVAATYEKLAELTVWGLGFALNPQP